MKKALLTLALTAMVFAASAQTNKWVAGGTGHWNHGEANTGDVVRGGGCNWRIEPFVGYQFTDRFRAGLTVGMIYQHETINGQDDTPQRTYRIGPYAHYDIIKRNRWILFAEAELIYGNSPNYPILYDHPGAATNYNVKSQYFNFTIKPGITYVLNDLINIDLNLNLLGFGYYNGKETRLDNNVESTGHGTELNLDLLESTPADWWNNMTIGITFKF